MKILVFWDVYGRIWRKALAKEIESLKRNYKPDFIICNIENCSSGRWPIEKHILELQELWIDICTGGDHIFDNVKSIKKILNDPDTTILRPANFYEQDHYNIPWIWYKIVEKWWKKLLVMHLMWQVFMNHHLYSPFLKCEEILSELKEKWLDFDASIIDFHCEASAEFYGMAHFIDGNVSAIFGTHTHVQTNDDMVLEKGTGMISDVWMNGPLYGVIGADYDSVRKRFLTWISKWLIEQSLDKNYVVSWVVFDVADDWLCRGVEKIRINWTI